MAFEELTTQFEEVSLVYRNKTKAVDRPQIRSPQDAYEIFLKTWNKDQINLVEECKLLLLDRKLNVMSIAEISKGGYSATIVDPKIIFSIALKRRAHRLILAHNHPTGNLNPSECDIKITEDIYYVGKRLSLPLDDHLIITDNGFTSLLENGDLKYDPTPF